MARKTTFLVIALLLAIYTANAASITITSPNGGEVWAGCTQKSITWTASGTSNNYTIDYTTDGGVSWISVTSSLYITSGSFSWTVPNINSTNCKIRIVDSNTPSCSDMSDYTFSITAPLLLISPNGGESWQAGSYKNINWVANGTTNYYDIYYSTNAGTSWTNIVNNQYISGQTYNWLLPNSPSEQCLIKIQDHSNTSCMVDISNNLFTITPPTPSITVSSPNGGNTLYAGNSYTISWYSAYVTSNLVKIEYSTDNANNWIPITTSTSNSGSYSWTVPYTFSTNCLVKITDLSNPATYDQSNSVFSIQPPFISLVSPNGGENWQGCSTQTISWTSGGTSGSYGIYYSTNNAASWNLLTTSSSSYYTWTPVPNLSSSACLVKVMDYNNAGIKDSSDAVFNISQNTDIIITTPNGGEQWEAGTYKNIEWVSAPAVTNFSVFYSINSGSSWTSIISNTYSKTLNWSVPNSPTANALIKVVDYSNSCKFDVSNANFTITNPTPIITLNYPNSNITTYANNSINIQWSTSYVTDNYVKIEITSDNGNSWTTVINPTENDGSYTWTLPNINSQNCRFRVSAFSNNLIKDESDVNFKVIPPFITVTSPNGGEQWKGCSSKSISWTSGGCSGSYSIYYSSNNGNTWNYISNTSSSYYTWSQVVDIPTSNNCLIKVQDYNNSNIKDSSDDVFTLIKNNDIIITTPNGDESWEVGTTKTISWVSEPTSNRYYTYYSINNGSSWNSIGSYTYSNSVSWTIPNSPNTTSLIKVSDYDNSCIQDVSNAIFTITPPQPYITVTNPNSNMTTYANNSINIQWISAYLSSSFVKIEFTYDNGVIWTTVVTPTENDGSYTWTLPNINSLNCKFRISEYNNPAINDISDVNFKVIPPFITVTSPNGGEQWKGCSSKSISWTSGGCSGSYSIYYSSNNGNTWNYISNTSSSYYTWSQVVDIPTSNNCLIKVQDYNNSNIKDSSDDVFTLIKNNDIIITTPNGDESWEVGTTKTISWVSEPTSNRYYTYYSINNGSSWNSIGSYTYSNSVSWTIPNSPNTTSLIKVSDYDNSCIQDVSNAIFTITPPQPYITVTNPNSNMTTYANNSINIQWISAYLSSSFVKIEFTYDNGVIWTTVVTPTENDGSYTWTLPNINSLNCKFRISEYNNPAINDISDVNFKVIPPFITVTSPNGGEQWKGCSSKSISWTSGGCSGSYSIYYSSNNGNTWNYISNTSSSYYTWSQVVDIPTSNNCLIKVQDYNNSNIKDSSDAVFTLIKNNDIIITTPNGGESWEVGTTKTISWVSEPTSNRFYPYYSINNGSSWNSIGSYTYSTSISWTIPNSPNTSSLIKIIDYDNSCIQDVSNTIFTIAPPQPYITVTYPNSNVTTYANNSINIQWISAYLSSSFVKIEFTFDNGSNWTTVVTPTENDGSYTWILPNINSLNCKFRISEYNNPSIFDESDVVFKIIPAFISVTSPNGGENWEGCTSKTISWTSGGTSGTFNLYYSTNNGASWNYINNTTSSSYTWSQVADVTTSNTCLIKVQDYSNTAVNDSSDAVFTLKQNDDIIINSPNGSEQWLAGSYQNINWVSAATSNRFYVYYSTNNGANWNSISSYTYSQNINWTVPNTPSTNCFVKVVDYDNTCIKDISNTNFSIIPGTPLLTYPNGGESLYYGSTYNISWTSEYFYSSYVSLNYSADSGASWLPIASVANNNGSYSWNVPNNFSNKCLLKVNEYNNPLNFDISNAIFSIKPGLVITSPNGDNGLEDWRVCTQTTIKWNTGGGSGNYKIEYSIDNGLNWTNIISSYSSSGSNNTYDWSIPNTPSTHCLIRITDNSYAIKTDISDASFTITPAIVINTPNGGESLQPGATQNISWTAIGSSSYYSIDYSINGGSTWTNIVYNQNIPGNSYTWLIPAASSSNCLIKVTDFINNCKLDKSDNAFAIGLPSPTITITSPNGGENLSGCVNQNITWSSTGTSGNYIIEYTSDSSLSWNTIISNYSTLSGTFSWNIPNINSSKCKIRIKDFNNGSTIDVSNNFFTISQSVTAVISANGPTTFCSGGNVVLSSSSLSGNIWYPGGQTTQSITVTSGGLYYVTVTNAGCTAVSNNIGVTANSLPAAPIASSNSPVALNGTLQLTASTIPNASYTWSGPNSFSSVQQNPTIFNASSVLNGVYSVRAIVNSCQSPVATINVTVSGTSNIVNISGNVHVEQGYLMNNVKMKLSGSGSNDSINTSSNGIYSFNVLQGNSYSITPSKVNDIPALSGLSTLDLILIQRHILNIQSLNSAYKIIAADVNQSGNVSTMDILLIKSLILQTASNFPNNEIWKFVNSDYSFPNPQQAFPFENTRSYSYANNLNDQNFIAIKLGDVNNSWNPNITKSSNVGNLNFEMNGQNANLGDIITIPVKVSNFNNISGYQFTMEWSPNDFEFVSVDNAYLTGYYGINHANSGRITALWSTENPNGFSLTDGTIVFELKLKVINQNQTNAIVQINASLTQSEAYNNNLEQLSILANPASISINNSISVKENEEKGYKFLQNIPNPFNDKTEIIFELPHNEHVIFEIYNTLGEVVNTISGDFYAGVNRITWDGRNRKMKALCNGSYYLQMRAGKFTGFRKLIILR
ncbi:MAG: hypothetical protein ACOYO1_06560 [Bacteroidales bacterium]